MPTSAEVLEAAARISQEAAGLALVWHILIGFFRLALAAGARPCRARMGLLASLPFLSVAALAWSFHNPFNGSFFLAAGLGLGITGARQERTAIQGSRPWATISGLGLIAFAWIYPHFLGDGSPWRYLYAAPMGLIPCPTTAMLLGFALLLEGFTSKSGSLILAATGVLYGGLGVFWLGVYADALLPLGSALLLLKTFLPLEENGRANGRLVRVELRPQNRISSPTKGPERSRSSSARRPSVSKGSS